MKLNKESKVRILEDFYAIDYTLFGKKLTDIKPKKELAEDYLSVKAALMSTMIEMFSLVEHSPKPLTEKLNCKKLTSLAKSSAKIARENCRKLVSTNEGRSDVKQEVRTLLSNNKNIKLEEAVNQKIREKAYRLAIDNLLIARTITESKSFNNLNEWEGKIIEDAYKILRDSLVESAISILDESSK